MKASTRRSIFQLLRLRQTAGLAASRIVEACETFGCYTQTGQLIYSIIANNKTFTILLTIACNVLVNPSSASERKIIDSSA